MHLHWDLETDVVVVGAGLAGYCAAYEAARKGADVVILEKLAEGGGSTALSGGFLAFAGTDVQQRAGIEDTEEILLSDLRKAGAGHNDERLLRTYVAHQREAYAWLRRAGVEFHSAQLSSAQSVPRSHATDPRLLMQTVSRQAHATGRVRTLFSSPAQRLLRDPATGKIAGVAAIVEDAARALRARHSVVLCCGGFSRSPDMLENFAPQQASAVHYGGAGNTGDGIRMAWALGAGFRDMGYIKGTFGYSIAARTQPGRDWTKLFVYRGAIAVNKLGKRFVDESLSYKHLGDAVLRQPDAMAYQICDQAIFDTAADGVPPFDFRSARQRGLMVEADCLEVLAAKLDIDAAILVATVRRYNASVDQGVDEEFGRDGLSNHCGALARIERAPFYAYATTSGLIATYCGLTVDEHARVIDVFGEPIVGLYAAGEIMGGFHGVAYMTGSALGKALIFGRIAGSNAA